MLPEVGQEKEISVVVGARKRSVVPLHSYITGNFGTEVEWELIGATSLVMWDSKFNYPNVAIPFVTCKEN